MGCGCGGKQAVPVPVDAETPDPNVAEENDAWWQAHPATPATPMPQ